MGNETLKTAGIEAHEKQPTIKGKAESIDALTIRLGEYQKETLRFLTHWEKLKENYPDFFEKLEKEHPGISNAVQKLEQFSKVWGEMSLKEVEALLEAYHFYSEQINDVVLQFNRKLKERQEQSFFSQMTIDDFKEEWLTSEEKTEVKAFAEELWEEMFPKSYVDRFVEWATGQPIAKDKSRWLLAPANGIEMAVFSFISVFKLKTYTDLYDTIEYMYGMSYEEWCDALQMLKLAKDSLSTDQKGYAAISLICSLGFFGGGLKTIMTKLGKLKCGQKIKKIIGTSKIIQTINEKSRPLPAAILSRAIIKFAADPFELNSLQEQATKGKIKGDTMAG